MPDNQTEAALQDLPPSSKFIYKTLTDEGSMTLKGLTEETMLSSRTVRYGLDQLEEADLVDSSPALHDGRQNCYSLAGGSSDGSDGGDAVLVSHEWVDERLSEFEADDPELCLVEADARAEYDDGHLPGAVHVDVLEDLVDVDGCGLADQRCFERIVGSRGITEASTVVIYSSEHNQYAAYLYWLFKYYRHTDVRLLDGGKQLWDELGGPLTTDRPTVTARDYSALPPDDEIRAYRDDVTSALATDTTIIDVRSEPEFRGERARPPEKNLPEARSSGHIPETVHLPWSEVVDDDGTFRPEDDLAALFRDLDVLPDTETIVYCHVGERSSLIWFVLSELLEYDDVANYDGSWIEWGNLIDAPVETADDE